MFRRYQFGLFLMVFAVATVIGQQPPEERPPIVDPEVEPAQFQRRGVWNGQLTSQQGPIPPVPTVKSSTEPRPITQLPPQPPTPTVQLSVLVPRDHPPGQEIPCTLQVTNTTAADAHQVVVRIGNIDGATISAAIPKPQDAQSSNWSFKILKAQETQKIELTLRPAAQASSVSVKAFVSFEHGQLVKTLLSDPKLSIKTELPKEPQADEPIAVRVAIRNGGRVPIVGAKLTQTISDGFSFHKEISGGEATKQPNQRLWNIGTIQAGETKFLQYLVTADKGRALRVLSVLDAEGKVQANDSADVTVLESGLKIRLSGDGKVTAEQAAVYEATVTNSGTIPLTNVQVAGTVPEDCRLTKMTRGGKEYRGLVYWTIPKLAPGESQSVRWGLQSDRAGRREIRARATNGRKIDQSATTETVVQGIAVLNWQTSFDRNTVAIDQQGVMSIVVRNSGTEDATDVRLTVTLPKASVSLVQASPENQTNKEILTFSPRTIAAGKSETFTITFKGEQFGRAYFNSKLSAAALDDRPLTTEKYVEIVRK